MNNINETKYKNKEIMLLSDNLLKLLSLKEEDYNKAINIIYNYYKEITQYYKNNIDDILTYFNAEDKNDEAYNMATDLNPIFSTPELQELLSSNNTINNISKKK